MANKLNAQTKGKCSTCGKLKYREYLTKVGEIEGKPIFACKPYIYCDGRKRFTAFDVQF